jgi:hypothetical protein
VPLNGRAKVPTSLAGGDFIDEIERAREAAHPMDQTGRIIEAGLILASRRLRRSLLGWA